MMAPNYMQPMTLFDYLVSFQAPLTVTYRRRCIRVNRDSVYGVELWKLVRRYPSAGSAYTICPEIHQPDQAGLWWVVFRSIICSRR